MPSWISLRGLRRLIRDDTVRKCPNVLFPVLQAICNSIWLHIERRFSLRSSAGWFTSNMLGSKDTTTKGNQENSILFEPEASCLRSLRLGNADPAPLKYNVKFLIPDDFRLALIENTCSGQI